MALYSLITSGSSVSQFVELLHAQQEAMRTLERGSTEPSVAVIGQLWRKTNYPYAGGAGEAIVQGISNGSGGVMWGLLIDARYAQLNAGGTVPLTGPLNFNGQKGIGAATATEASDLLRMDQAVLRNGSQGLTANWDLGGFTIIAPVPTDPSHVARLGDLGTSKPGQFQDGWVGTSPRTVTMGYQPGVVLYSLSVGGTIYSGVMPAAAVDTDVPIDHGGGITFTLRRLSTGVRISTLIGGTKLMQLVVWRV